MIVYNVTVVVEPKIHDEWLDWMKNEHLPEVLATGRFLNCSMFVINPQEPEKEPSYSIQYQAETMAHYNLYVQNEAEGLKAKTYKKYGENVLAYRTLLEHVLTLKP